MGKLDCTAPCSEECSRQPCQHPLHACICSPAAEASSLCSSQWEEGHLAAAPATSLAALLGALGKAGTAWADRVSLYQAVQGALQQSGVSQAAAAEVASNADRLIAALLEGCGDAHFRVAAAALAALGEGLAGPSSRIFEPQLDRVMTTLFARWVVCTQGCCGCSALLPLPRCCMCMQAGLVPTWDSDMGLDVCIRPAHRPCLCAWTKHRQAAAAPLPLTALSPPPAG